MLLSILLATGLTGFRDQSSSIVITSPNSVHSYFLGWKFSGFCIANSLGGATGRLPGSVLAAAKRKRPGDLGAYELFLLGRDKAAGLTLENQLEAKKLLEQAIQIDPTLARAHAMLAWTYSWRASLEADTAKLTQEMLAAARRAVELDPKWTPTPIRPWGMRWA